MTVTLDPRALTVVQPLSPDGPPPDLSDLIAACSAGGIGVSAAPEAESWTVMLDLTRVDVAAVPTRTDGPVSAPPGPA
jgi:hypothetical protein